VEAADVAGPFLNDRDVLAAARDGSEEAGRRLVADHGPSMLRTAWHVLARYGGNDAEDVVQEAFIAALTTKALPEGDVGAWLRAIAARKAVDVMRGVQRRRERPLPETGEGETELPAATGSFAAVDVLAVREALAQLSPLDRAVLVLVDLEGHSMAEAAVLLGTTNVGTRLRAVRARRKLAKQLRSGESS
jgi:RNA polymerase sigma-70 factor (ECF subfamily)